MIRARSHARIARVVILQPYIAHYRAKFLSELMKLSKENGVELVIFAGNPTGNQAKRNDNYALSGVEWLRQWELHLFGRRIVLRFIPLRVFSADLIIWEQARRNIDVYACLVPRAMRTFRSALWGHGADYMGSRGRFDKWLRKILTRKVDWFFAYTKLGGESAASQGLPKDRISVVFNSTDTRLLQRQMLAIGERDLLKFQNQLNLSKKNTIIFMGGLDESKRISLILEVSKRLRSLIPDFALIVCGDGADRHLVEEAAVENSWIKYLGPATDERKALALAAAKLILNPGLVGLIAVDSLAAGRPIVTCRDVNHAPEFEYLVDGETCLVAKGTPVELAAAVQTLLADSASLRRLSRNCLDAADSLSSETMAKNFFDGIVKSLST